MISVALSKPGAATLGALIGGTASAVTGGKFANGAISGAIQGAMSGPQKKSFAHNGRDKRDFSGVPTDELKQQMASDDPDDRIAAAKSASKWFGIDDSGVTYAYNANRYAKPGQMLINGEMRLGDSAFTSWDQLGAVIGHEIEMHWQTQYVGRGWTNESQLLWAGEYEAYDYSIRNAGRFGNSAFQVGGYRAEMQRAFNNLTPTNQRVVLDGKYSEIRP